MEKDIRFLLVFLIIAIGVLVWLQCYHCNPVPNEGQLNMSNVQQHFTLDNNSNKISNNINSPSNIQRTNDTNKGLNRKIEDEDKIRSSKENQKVKSKIIDNILKNENLDTNLDIDLDSMLYNDNMNPNDNDSLDNLSIGSINPPISKRNSKMFMKNPMDEDINTERNSLLDSDQQILDKLIKEVNTGNDLIVDNPKSDLFRNKTKSINSAKKYRNISYKDSEYRQNFNDDESDQYTQLSQTSQDELNSMYEDSYVFRNNEYNTNGNFKGFNETNDNYGSANLNDFKPSGPQTQQEKTMALYNSNDYLPNKKLLDKKLTKGFQILDNPVSVSNPNLIPVLKSIPVSSVMSSNRNQSYDIRAQPPCPKTVVSPFLNSCIVPDIYSTQRGCL